MITPVDSTVLLWQYRNWPDDGRGTPFHWTVFDESSGTEWLRRGGGYGGGVSDTGRCDGGGAWRFDSVPATGDRLRVRCAVGSEIAFDELVVLRAAPVRHVAVSVAAASSRPGDNELRVLVAALTDRGWRQGRTVPDELTAVEAPPITFGTWRLRVLTDERWGAVRHLTFRIEEGQLEPIPLRWDLDIDGVRFRALTDGLQGAPGGGIGHLAVTG